MIDKYELERFTREVVFDEEMLAFFVEVAARASSMYGEKFNWEKFDLYKYLRTGGFLFVCRKNKKPVGLCLAKLYFSVFDGETKLLRHDLLYGEPGTKAGYLLFKAYLDFGKHNANHILGTIGEHTNINPRSLEKLGFKKLDTIFRLEIR